jgi:hypothetical protein
MLLRRINNLFVIMIIVLSTGLFNLHKFGSGQKAAELLGIGIILGLLIIHFIYSDQKVFKMNFIPFIILIFLSLVTSMFTANYVREQSFGVSLFAQRAIFYYFFYFLLHQLKIKPRDLEIIFVIFGVLHIVLYLAQYFSYPKILFDVFMISDRGTIRIYLKGSDYLALCYFMSMYALLRTNKIKYLVYMLASFSIFVLLGGRQTMALMVLVLFLALLFTKKIRSRVLFIVMMAGCALLVFYLFQGIFMEMITTSNRNRAQGSNYVRISGTRFFLTDFFKSRIAYITGNGVPGSGSSYGSEMNLLRLSKGYYLGDIGVIGVYVTYGLFFILGLVGIFYKVFTTKIDEHYLYIKYMFLGAFLSLITGGGFAEPDFICFVCCLLYLVDVTALSNETVPDQIEST